MTARGGVAEWLDLAEIGDIPICDGETCWSHPAVQAVQARAGAADALLLATPVYNWMLAASAKNFIELTGRKWAGKVVGFLCAAGATRSHRAIMSAAAAMMLDFHALVVPRFAYATGDDFGDDGAPSPDLAERVERVAAETVGLARAWPAIRTESPA